MVKKQKLTDNAVGVLLLEGGQRGDDEAEGGDHHKQARHYRHHLPNHVSKQKSKMALKEKVSNMRRQRVETRVVT
jgi:hypothetical protein